MTTLLKPFFKPGSRLLLLVCLLAVPLSYTSVCIQSQREIFDLQIQLNRHFHGDPPLADDLVLVALDKPSSDAGLGPEDLQTAAERIPATTRLVPEKGLEDYFTPDSDGTLRGIRLFKGSTESPIWAPYILDLAKFQGIAEAEIRLQNGMVFVGNFEFPINERGQIYPYFPVPNRESALFLREFGTGGFFDSLRFKRRDSMQRLHPVSMLTVPSILDRLEDKMVVLGEQRQYASGLEVPTPMGKMVTLDLYGSALDALLAGHYVKPMSGLASFALTTLFLVWICFLLPGKDTLSSLGWWCLVIAAWLGLHQLCFFYGTFGNSATGLLTALVILVSHFLTRSRLLARYLYGFGGHVAVEIEESEIEATIVFTNLPAAIEELESEDLEKANALRAAYSDCIGRITESHHGRVVDLQGDAQMLAFGLSGQSNHALSAVSCSLDIVREASELLEEYGRSSQEQAIHCGVVTGVVARGQVGAGAYKSVAAIGDTTNTAARLMGKAKKAGVAVLASRRSVESSGAAIEYRDYGEISVKGKEELIPVKEILSTTQPNARPRTTPQLKPPRLPILLLLLSLLLSPLLAYFLDMNLPIRLMTLDSLADSQRGTNVRWAGLDETSLSYGTWPWPRSWHARVIENCQKAGVKCLFFDLLFDEPSLPVEDQSLLEAVENSDIVVVAAAAPPDSYNRPLPPTLIPGLLETKKWGLINVIGPATEQDELLRSALWQMEGIRTNHDDAGSEEFILPGASKTVAKVCDAPVQQTLRDRESFLIRWGPQPKPFSYYRLLDPQDPIFQELKGSVVVVADALQGPSDQFETPLGPIKGGLLHCLSIQTSLTEDFLWDFSRSPYIILLSLLFAAGTLTLSFRHPSAGSQFCILLLACGSAIVLTELAADWASVYLGTMHLLTVPCVLVAAAVMRIVDISSDLSCYVPKAVQLKLETEGFADDKTTTGTILLTDIRGYTSLSEGRSPLEVLGLLNRYHELTVACYERHGGHLLTYQGDAQIVVFGPLEPVSNPVLQALKAAAELEPLVQQVAREAGLDEDNALRVGAGITTGPVTISLLKAGGQLQYTVLGDPVRRAHKLQSQSDEVGSNILLDEESYFQLRGVLACDQHTDDKGRHFYTPK